MEKQEIKQLISEFDRCNYQIPNLQALTLREGATSEMKLESLRQLNECINRRDEIQVIFDESGEDIDSLRNEDI